MEQRIEISAINLGPMADVVDHAQLAPAVSRVLRNCWFREGYADMRPTWGSAEIDPSGGDGCLGSGFYVDNGSAQYITIVWDEATGRPVGWDEDVPCDDITPDCVMLVIPWRKGAFLIPSHRPGGEAASGKILYHDSNGNVFQVNADAPQAPDVTEHTESGSVMPGVYSYILQYENETTGILSPPSKPTTFTVGLNDEDADGPSAGPVVTVNDEGTLGRGARLYAVSFYNSANDRETPLGAASTAIITQDNSKVVLTGIPKPKDSSHWPKKRLYVSDAAGPFLRLATLTSDTTIYVDDGSVTPTEEHQVTGTSIKILQPDGGGEEGPPDGSSWKVRVYRSSGGSGFQLLGYMSDDVFIDTYETAEESPGGGELLTEITNIPQCNHACASAEGLVVWVGEKGASGWNKAYIASTPDQPIAYDEEVELDPRFGPVTAVARCDEDFIVFTSRSIQAISPSSGRAYMLATGYGCLGPRAWCEIPNGIAFASRYGPAFIPKCSGDARYVGPDPDQFVLRDLWEEMFADSEDRPSEIVEAAAYKVRCMHVPNIPAVVWFFQRGAWPAEAFAAQYTFDTAIMWEYSRKDGRLTVHDLVGVQDALLTLAGSPAPLCWVWPNGWKRLFAADVAEAPVMFSGLSADGNVVSGFTSLNYVNVGDVLYVASGTGRMDGSDVQRLVDHVIVSKDPTSGTVTTARDAVLDETSTVWLNGYPWVVDIGPIVPPDAKIVKRWTRICLETAQ